MYDLSPVTHAHDSDIVVFNIGMTISKPHRVDLWGPVFAAMPKMLAELGRARAAHLRGEGPDLGFLGGVSMFGSKGPWVTQYWSDPAKLIAYAANPDGKHLPEWRRFNRATRKAPGAVGIWHETFVVPAANIETFASGGARVGLIDFTGAVPLAKRGKRAAERLAGATRG